MILDSYSLRVDFVLLSGMHSRKYICYWLAKRSESVMIRGKSWLHHPSGHGQNFGAAIFNSHEKMWVYIMSSVKPAVWLAGPLFCSGKNFNIAIFVDTIDIINVKFCMMVLLIEFYPFIPLSVTFIIVQSHGSVKQF